MKRLNIPDGFPFNGEVCFVEGSLNLNDYLCGGFDEGSRDDKASYVLGRLMEKYGVPKCGRNRATFIGKFVVIKFPLNDDGEDNNLMESEFISKNTARGKLLDIDGFRCVVQEKVNALEYPLNCELYPDWVKVIDSCQVGYTLKGVLKAYDFADNIDKLSDNGVKLKI